MKRLPWLVIALAGVIGVFVWRLQFPGRPHDRAVNDGRVADQAVGNAPGAMVGDTMSISDGLRRRAEPRASLQSEPAGQTAGASGLERFTYAQGWAGPQSAVFAAFRDWVAQYLRAGNAAERAALESSGIAAARARRAAMRALIEADPQVALALTMPAGIRARLPAAITAELESRFSIVGNFTVLAVDYGPEELARRRSLGLKSEVLQRIVTLNGSECEAFVYGRRAHETTKEGIPLHGVVLDGAIALHEAALRVLEPEESAMAAAAHDGSAAVLAEAGRKIVGFASVADLLRAEARFEAAEKGLGPVPRRIDDASAALGSPDSSAIDSVEPQEATAWTTGNKKVLYIRVDFSDFPGNPVRNGTIYTAAYLQNLADTQVSPFYVQSSYGRTSLTNTVTPGLYRMPHTAAFYATSGTNGANSQLHADAQAAVASEYTPANYDRIVVVFRSLGGIANSKITYGGLALLGAKHVWINGEFDFRVVAHELGHTYGLEHANLWQVSDGNPVSADGTSTEYGDDFDTMGANFANDQHTDFNPWFKNLLGWAADHQVPTITASGTYRVNRLDNNLGTGTLGLKIPRDSTRSYWVGVRRSFTTNASMQNGAYVIWGYDTNQQSNLLDLTTPGTNDQDAALAVGATLTDPVGNLSIKTVAIGGTAPNEFADIQVTLALNGAPLISLQPQGRYFFPGDAITLSVAATGTAPLSYQWRKDGAALTGATNSTFSIASAQPADAGAYTVRVSNPVGNVDSVTAVLGLNTPPVIISPPTNITIAAGLPARFDVVVAGGLTPSYQWRKNGVILPGATTAGLSFATVQSADAGTYDVMVTNALGGALSAPATLTVNLGSAVPSNDNFASAWILPGNFGSGIGTNVGATGETGEPTNYTTSGSGGKTSSVWFRWTPSVSGSAQIDTIGSAAPGGAVFDTVLAVYTGSSLTALTKLAQDDDAGVNHTSKVTINVTAGTTYSIVVGGFDDPDRGAVVLNYAMRTAPLIVVQPATQTLNEGGSAVFSVSAVGVAPLSYQWQRNGVAIAGEWGTSLTVGPASLSMSGDQFRCVVTGGLGSSTTSAAATLTVNPVATVIITSANAATFNVNVPGNFAVKATGTPAPTFSVTSGTFPSWATLNPTTGAISGTPPDTTGAPFDFTLQATNGVSSPATQNFTLNVVVVPTILFSSPPRQVVALGGGAGLKVTAVGFPAPTYQWMRNGLSIGGATTDTLLINGATTSDRGWYQAVVANNSGSVTSDVMFLNVAVSSARVFAWGNDYQGATAVPVGLGDLIEVAAGGADSFALRSDGTVVAWGQNNFGQTTVPAGLGNVVEIAAGGAHALALKSDGTVVAWGENGFGQATVPAGLNKVVRIAAGGSHSLALKSDGTVVAWGANANAQCSVPAGLDNVVGVAAGATHSLAWRADGTVVAWGDNTNGQTAVPAGLSNVIGLAGGSFHTVAVKADGTVVAWGANSSNQSIVPVGLANVVGVAAGFEHSVALKADGRLAVWGSNGFGQVLVPTEVANVVGLASGLSHVVALCDPKPVITHQPQNRSVSAGQKATFSVVAKGLGTLAYQWRKGGVTIVGATNPVFSIAAVQAGDVGTFDAIVTNAGGGVISLGAELTIALPDSGPTIITPPADQIVTAGSTVTFAVVASGAAPLSYQWRKDGANIDGATDAALPLANVQLDATGTYDVVVTDSTGSATSNIAILTVAQAGVVAVSAGGSHLLFLRSDGTLYAAGNNINGQLGDGSTTRRAIPVLVASDVVTIAAGGSHSLFIKSDGTLWGMGANNPGQLGDGTLNDRLSPVPLATAVVAIAAGNAHSLLVRSDGSLWAMGNNASGQLGDGTTTLRRTPVMVATNVVAVAGGEGHSMFIKSDGTLWGMGGNSFGQLGDGTFSERHAPVQVATGVAAVSAATYGSLFLKFDGTLWGIGYNYAGALGDGSTANRSTPRQMAAGVTAFAAGYIHHVFAKSDGSLWALGNNTNGQFGNGSAVFSQLSPLQVAAGVAAVASATYRTYYTKLDGSLWGTGTNSFGELGDGTMIDRTIAEQLASGLVLVPGVPNGVTASVGTLAAKVRLAWTPVIGATAYEVWRATTDSSAGAVRIAANLSAPFFDDLSTVTGTVYYYWVKSANPAGSSGFGASATGYNAGSFAAPVITAQPAPRIVNAGTGASFTVTATGLPAPTYQWRKDGGNIADATNATLMLTNVQSGDAGSYDVVVTNSSGSVTSSTVTLTVISPPSIATEPQNVVVASGQTATVSVTATGTGPFSYQWYRGTSPNTTAPIAGANAASYTTPALTEATSYWVRVSNAAGSADSATAVVLIALTTPLVALTSESGADYSTAGGAATMRVRVTYTGMSPSAIGVVLGLPAGWTFASYSGPSAASAPVAGDTAPQWSFSVFPANELTFTFSANYAPGLTGAKVIAGSVNYSSPAFNLPFAALTFAPVIPPAITTQPVGKAVGVDAGVTFAVGTTGTGPLSYQWKKNGVSLVEGGRVTGVTTATLAIATVTLADAAGYSVLVSNAAGSVVSDSANLAVVEVRASHGVLGPGYVSGGAVVISNTITYSGTLTGLGWSVLPPSGWSYRLSAGTDGEVKPADGATDLLEWAWTTIPASPVTFSYTLNVPAGTTGTQELTALVLPRQPNTQFEMLVKPDPLVVAQVTRHSADTDFDLRFSLPELLRVIELYNTRNGTVRTGAYAVDASNPEDGFAADGARVTTAVVTLSKYHSADSDHDGKLKLTELLRMIELYNHRTGTVRDGVYHSASDTEDGFATGP